MAGRVWPTRGAGGADAWQEPHGRSTWAPLWGATWQIGSHVEGPRDSGPWLDFRGGNALGVYHPLIYRGECILFLPCGTMSHTVPYSCR